ncbi:MAG: hypothetical protein HKN04_01890, partial [Rhodothermaceae bacterium]|nr:hypothetical protein [Rhodothermaceae bacterium]
MAELDGVELEDSFIPSWRYSPSVGGLLFELEARLCSDHTAWEQPMPSEFGCYKRAELLFAAASVSGTLPEQSAVQPTQDSDGSRDYGSFDSIM